MILLLICVPMLCGCALMDSLMLDPMRDANGERLYIDISATEALPEAEREAGKAVLVRESQREPGRAYEQAYRAEPSAAVRQVESLANLIPGWGGLAAALTGLFAGGYAALRGKRRLEAAVAGRAAMAGLSAELVSTIEAIQRGELDTDGDGKVSLREIRAFVRKRGKRALKPDVLARVVNIVTSSLTPTEQQRELERLTP
jgi:hypothetical protein